MSKALATPRNTEPVSRFSPQFLVSLSTWRACCSKVPCLGLNPNSLSRNGRRSLKSFMILGCRIYTNSLSIVPSRLMVRQHVGRARSFPVFRMEITRACFYYDGKYWMVWISLKRRVIARHGKCFRAPFGIPSGSGALPNLKLLMTF